MTRAECEELLFVIQAAYPSRITFSDEAIEVWCEMLGDLPAREAATAVKQLCQTGRHPPSIAEIRRACVEMCAALPSVEEAEEQLRQAVRAFSPYRPPQPWSGHELVRRAAASVGGIETIAYSEQPEWLYRDFRRAYQAIRERELERLQTDPGAIAEAARLPGARLTALPGGARGAGSSS